MSGRTAEQANFGLFFALFLGRYLVVILTSFCQVQTKVVKWETEKALEYQGLQRTGKDWKNGRVAFDSRQPHQ